MIYDPPVIVPDKEPDYVLPDETDRSKTDKKEALGRNQLKKVVINFKTYGIRKAKATWIHLRKIVNLGAQNVKREYPTIDELNRHFIDKHRKLKCKDCGKTFQKPRSYQKHLYAHNVKKAQVYNLRKRLQFLEPPKNA